VGVVSAPRRWFLPPGEPDLPALLSRQGQITVEALAAFVRWSAGEKDQEDVVRAKEHEADAARREVLATVRNAFVTSISPEDAFELSERLDTVLNGAKDVTRESDVLAMAPDRAMAEMAGVLAEAVGHLGRAFPLLVHDPGGATDAADAAVTAVRQIERIYRTAMSALLEETELREVAGRRELYRRYARLGEAVEHVAHRVWYTVVKQD
jgi:uncharacterized protein Yka (UPF0111/DUF47 family)